MTTRSEPLFNIPAAVIAVILACVIVQVARDYVLTPDQDDQFLLAFAFIPARYDPAVMTQLPGGVGSAIWTFVTYAFLHGSWIHLGVNAIWFLPFGSAVARRFGSARFLAFFAATAIAGALAHLVTHVGGQQAVIGASAAISGCMAAAIRFAFARGGPLSLLGRADEESYRVSAAPLSVVLRDTRVVIFVGSWFLLNILFGLGTLALPGADEAVAWQAHIGGFLAGLLLFPMFDPVLDPVTEPSLDASAGEESPPLPPLPPAPPAVE